MLTRRIFISSTIDQHLSEAHRGLKRRIIRLVRDEGYACEMFDPWHSEAQLAQGQNWSQQSVDDVVRRCIGAIVIGLRRWTLVSGRDSAAREVRFASEYCHYEAAVAFGHDLPMLVISDESLEQRGVFSNTAGPFIVRFPADASEEWVDSAEFRRPFERWLARLLDRRDLFLGYCSESTGIAHEIRDHLEQSLGLKVLDWQRDFAPGGTIMDQIAEAARRCTAGIFLFTRDDLLAESTEDAAPRDNVVLETGYFAHSKGFERVLVIREEGSKMPADLGGVIYLNLADRSNVSATFDTLRRFADDRL
jgi:hypothetical protein